MVIALGWSHPQNLPSIEVPTADSPGLLQGSVGAVQYDIQCMALKVWRGVYPKDLSLVGRNLEVVSVVQLTYQPLDSFVNSDLVSG